MDDRSDFFRNDAFGNDTDLMTATYIGYLITTNMGTTANITHMFLWNFDE